MSIDIRKVSFTYLKDSINEHHALKDISLFFEDHSFIGIVGETGSGKSTLIQHLNGLLIPNEGEIIIDEFKIDSKKRKQKNLKNLRKHVGVVFQFPEYQLFEETVLKDVAFGPKNFKYKEEEALAMAKDALASVGINEDYYDKSPFELSGGEKRRVAIAGILAINPDILVLDEPTAGLDPYGVEVIMNLVLDLYNKGKTIILVTHDMDLLLKYCQKVVVLKDGEVSYNGTPKNLFDNLDDTSSIDIPFIYSFIHKLNERGFNIKPSDVTSIHDLIKIIKGRIKDNG
ncbi:MAG: energy-coupling factor transporter ATPase [Bacilli bacterium]|nr:energy-coupling factor transporter ATPase [Bacilli bacterium]